VSLAVITRLKRGQDLWALVGFEKPTSADLWRLAFYELRDGELPRLCSSVDYCRESLRIVLRVSAKSGRRWGA
jgi:hypothetical protein